MMRSSLAAVALAVALAIATPDTAASAQALPDHKTYAACYTDPFVSGCFSLVGDLTAAPATPGGTNFSALITGSFGGFDQLRHFDPLQIFYALMENEGATWYDQYGVRQSYEGQRFATALPQTINVSFTENLCGNPRVFTTCTVNGERVTNPTFATVLVTFTATPEPGTLVLTASGILGLFGVARKQRLA